jgi:hypothetical protein
LLELLSLFLLLLLTQQRKEEKEEGKRKLVSKERGREERVRTLAFLSSSFILSSSSSSICDGFSQPTEPSCDWFVLGACPGGPAPRTRKVIPAPPLEVAEPCGPC